MSIMTPSTHKRLSDVITGCENVIQPFERLRDGGDQGLAAHDYRRRRHLPSDRTVLGAIFWYSAYQLGCQTN